LLKTFLYDWLQLAKKYASTKKIINNCYCGLVDDSSMNIFNASKGAIADEIFEFA
jgi:hypothetical protein